MSSNMKYSKRILTVCASLFIMTSFAACGGNDDNGGSSSNGDIDFKMSKTQMTFTCTGGATDFSVQSTQKPSVSSDAEWIKATERTSTSTTVYRYDLTAVAYTGTDDRMATITVTVGGESKTINVTQTAADGLIVSSDKNVSVAAEGGSIIVKLRANGTYTVSSSAEWITGTSRANMQDYEEVFNIASNIGAERTATISFTLNDITESVTVTQAKGNSSNEISATAMQLAKLMYPGWNLGNTMEATGTGVNAEVAWQSTKTTQAIIDYVKEQGFKSIRIPCSWYIHSTDGNIDAAWMSRVQEIVDYCIKDGLYVVLNDHWDNGWIEVEGFSKSSSSYEAVDEATITSKISMLKTLWTQIANNFKDYDEHLLFAGMNEPFQEYSLFNSRHKELTPILLRYNQAFIDAVRATGGNNVKRTLVVQGPSVSISSTCESSYGFTMPTDIDNQTGYLMAEVHYYEPWDFCGESSSSAKLYWGSANHVSGSSYNCTWGEEDWTTTQMSKMKTNFYDKGYPVILGEYGANWRDVSSVSGNQTKHDAAVKAWFKDVTTKAINCGIVPFVWDINSANKNGIAGTMTIINRANLSVFCTPALEGITAGVSAASWPN